MKYIQGFDGLRFYSIFLVIITHLGFGLKSSHKALNYFFSGTAGVIIFFAISGFLITSLILHEISKTGRFNIKWFFIRRFLRLLPPMIPFYIVLVIFMYMGWARDSYLGILAAALYVYNFIPRVNFLFSGELSHTWSLSVEEQFYLLWSLLFFRYKLEHIKYIGISLIFVCIIGSFVLPSVGFSYHNDTRILGEVFFVNRWLIPAIGPILIGSMFAIINYFGYMRIKERISGKRAGVFSFFLFLLPIFTPELLLPIIRMIHAIGVSILLVWVVNNQTNPIISILEFKFFRYIGRISYGLYIWQGLFLRTSPNWEPSIWVHQFPINIILTVTFAVLSYEYYEKYILKYKSRFKPRPKTQASPEINLA